MAPSVYVLYHGNCYDGFGAAYAAWKKFGSGAVYIPVSYGYPPPAMPGAHEVYILDFSYPQAILQEMVDAGLRVTVIDHHKTAQESLLPMVGTSKNLAISFDMSKSGALLAWEAFHPRVPAPLLISHISDRDLWKFELDGSAKIHTALVSYPMDFETWDQFDVEQLKVEGVTCKRLYSSLVENIVKSSWVGRLDGMAVPMVNTSIAWSEVGAALLKKFNAAPQEVEARKAWLDMTGQDTGTPYPMVASFTIFNDQVMWSLRSIPEFDCSAVAKKFGGGGHKNAAGFKAARY